MKPYIHAFIAGAYIVLIVLGIQLLQKPDTPDTLVIPMFMLSMLVFSVSVMAYLFFFQPVLLFMEGKHTEAATFFFKTVGGFAILVVLFFILVLFGF